MGFEYLGVVEKRIQKMNNYYHLLHKFYDGKSLEDRTQLDFDDFLDKCNGQASNEIKGVKYCGGVLKKLDCKYQCEPIDRGLRPCSRIYPNGVSYFITLKTIVYTNLSQNDVEELISDTNKLEILLEEDLNVENTKTVKIITNIQ
jgi:hypothetical protein